MQLVHNHFSPTKTHGNYWEGCARGRRNRRARGFGLCLLPNEAVGGLEVYGTPGTINIGTHQMQWRMLWLTLAIVLLTFIQADSLNSNSRGFFPF